MWKPKSDSDAGMLRPSDPPKGATGNRRSDWRQRRHRVLVVDDDSGIVVALATALRNSGYDVNGVVGGSRGLSVAREHPPDLVVLGLKSSDFDLVKAAIELHCDGLRVPILFVGGRVSGPRRVGGLIVGGDDHISKPFALAEVVARVHRMIHRADAGVKDDPVLRFADIALDQATRVVTRAGGALPLTPQEFSLLRYFLLNPRRVHSKAQLIHHVWRYDFRGCDNVAPVCVGTLRRKLETAGPPVIHTVRGMGYILR